MIDLVATIAKGGIHSNEGGRFLKPEPDEEYWQIDIGSQYPNAIRKYKVEPRHLKGWNELIVSKIDRRLKYKKQYQETNIPKFNSLQKMGKLALNGGSYGRLNTKGDWQEYPYGMLQVTVGGQLEILMVVEDLILKGFNVVSLNTDGFDCIIKKARNQEFRNILTNWEKVIGNDVLGNFEYTQFQWIAQTSVNDYLALKMDGKIKAKGDFEIDKELHKNKSMRIIPIALKEHYVNNIPIEQTIKNHTNMYDFCIARKASRDFHFEGIKNIKSIEITNEELFKLGWYESIDGTFQHPTDKRALTIVIGEIKRQKIEKEPKTIYNKLIRYYVSEKGEKLLKIKNPECQTDAPDVAQLEAGEWLCKVVNYLPKRTVPQQAGINYKYYIDKAQAIIDKVKLEGRRGAKKEPKNQLSLF